MRKFVSILIAVMLLVTACSNKKAADERWPADIEGNTFTKSAHKVVSLSPSVTESMYMLGYGGRLDGVSDFCKLNMRFWHIGKAQLAQGKGADNRNRGLRAGVTACAHKHGDKRSQNNLSRKGALEAAYNHSREG